MRKKFEDIKNCSTGYLLIHGFGGNTDEVKPLADFLIKRGYRVECPSLKGHTGIRRDLMRCTYSDWINSAKEVYDKLQSELNEIIIVGFSMGGLIGIQLASENKVRAIVTLNTPIYYWDFRNITNNIIADLKCKSYDSIYRYIDSFKRLPLRAAVNFRLLLSRTKPLLKEIKCPIFSAQALKDDTVRNKSAKYIYDHIGSAHKYLKFYKNSGHCILWSKEADNVINDVMDFIHRVNSKSQ